MQTVQCAGNNQHALDAIRADRRQMTRNPAEFCLTRKIEMRDACVTLCAAGVNTDGVSEGLPKNGLHAVLSDMRKVQCTMHAWRFMRPTWDQLHSTRHPARCRDLKSDAAMAVRVVMT